jgi:hypothetical protein
MDPSYPQYEKTYDAIKTKVDAAVELLKEARDIARKGGDDPKDYQTWYQLRDIIDDFVDLQEDPYGWTCSMF